MEKMEGECYGEDGDEECSTTTNKKIAMLSNSQRNTGRPFVEQAYSSK